MLKASIILVLFAQFITRASLAERRETQPGTAALEFLKLSNSASLWGVQTGGQTPCNLQISVIDSHSEFVMLSLPVTDAVTVSSSLKGAVSCSTTALTMVSDNDIQLSIPEIGIPLGFTHEHVTIKISRLGSNFHVDAERKISGITIGDHNISLSCDFFPKTL